jgi:uncharacterized protein (DUF885 family)
MTTHRSAIFQLSDEYMVQSVALSPINATSLGVPGYDHLLNDFSLAGSEKSAVLVRSTLAKLATLQPIDDIDRVAAAVLKERLESGLALHDSHENHILWSVLASPVSSIRQVFELMPHSSAAEIETITQRLGEVKKSMQSWVSCVTEMQKLGKVTARRQVLGVADQLAVYAQGAYQSFASGIDSDKKYPHLHSAAAQADAACGEISKWLSDVYAPLSNPVDGVGIERYSHWSRYFTGATLDLKAIYEWGIQDLAAINARMWRVAAQIKPDAKSLREVADYLETAPDQLIHGSDELLTKLKDFTQAAVKKLDGTHFDIDDRIKFCDARLAPEGSAAAPYYMPPSEDLSRPGTTWYPTMSKDVFSWWHIASTWYHEAVPGHHLQCATAILESDRLTRFQRTDAWISGYGEGWALYAERLMDELGAFDEPGIEMGYLSGQALRAARIVVDIGMHLGYKDENGNVWNAESAYETLVNKALMDEDFARSEIDRYLGWPGQAISYKVGEKVWMQSREDAKQRLGAAFELKKFHSYALKLGPMGLDPFAAEMQRWDGK